VARRKKHSLLAETKTTQLAAQLSSNVGAAGRDRLTRVKSPIKGVDTQGKQWGRWSP
jgi:hypothetical protein